MDNQPALASEQSPEERVDEFHSTVIPGLSWILTYRRHDGTTVKADGDPDWYVYQMAFVPPEKATTPEGVANDDD